MSLSLQISPNNSVEHESIAADLQQFFLLHTHTHIKKENCLMKLKIAEDIRLRQQVFVEN